MPPPLLSIPINNRNLTGSPHRKRSVDKASETAVWPICTLFCEPCDNDVLSQAVVSNCNARIRDRIPWPVAAAASGSKPIGDVPRRAPASGLRVEQRFKHCLQFVIKSFSYNCL